MTGLLRSGPARPSDRQRPSPGTTTVTIPWTVVAVVLTGAATVLLVLLT